MADKEYIEREALIENLNRFASEHYNALVNQLIIKQPAADVVSRSVFEQVKWERDIAMEQLKDHKIPFGCIAPDVVEVVRCKNCKYGAVPFNGWIDNGRKHCNRIGKDVSVPDDFYCGFGERK